MEVKWRSQPNLRTKFNFSGTKFNHKMSQELFSIVRKKKDITTTAVITESSTWIGLGNDELPG